MTPSKGVPADRTVPEALKFQYLEKVATSSTFVRAEQLQRLFRWLGKKSLDGGAAPTEYEVARGALGKPENFDPQTDSLVRKEMNRLRIKLRDYYLKEGASDAVEIRNHGPYKLSFEFKRHRQSSSHVSCPCVLVLPLYGEAVAMDAAESFYGELQAQLAADGRVDLVAQTTARQLVKRGGDIRDFASETGASFIVEGTARQKDGEMQFTLFLVDGETGRTSRSHRVGGLDIENAARAGVRWLIECLCPSAGTADDQNSCF